MRSRTSLLAFFFITSLFALPFAAHAGIPFFGPIVPPEVNRCAAGWGAVIDVINRLIEFLITIAILFVAPLMIAWSGFLFVWNPVDPGGIAKAKGILTNTVVGIVIALAGWLIVAAVMAVLYDANAPVGTTGGVLGTWSNIVSSGGKPFCLIQEGALQKLKQTDLSITGVNPPGTGVYVGGKAGVLCSDSNTNCSPATLQNAGFKPAQANAMSCIAMTESSGNTNTKPSATGACGLFQITNKTSKSNWQNPKYHKGNCSVASSCNDPVCNTQTAQLMFAESGYQPWTGICKNRAGCGIVAFGQPWNPGARECVNRYDPGKLVD